MKINQEDFFIDNLNKTRGTLAIDLGNTTTIVAFQAENDNSIKLLKIPPLSRSTGEIPSIIWKSEHANPYFLFGREAEELILEGKLNQEGLISNFKPWICAPKEKIQQDFQLTPKEAGELLIKEIWSKIPKELEIKKLVLSTPVETYKDYRKWLHTVCIDLDVQEIAIVDEPTAAAIGAGKEGGSKILVIDIGGSTIDMSMVVVEGGEGKAEPIAQLIRFKGEDLEGVSKQIIRGATVIGKSGINLGGRDFDKWILNHLCPDLKQSEILLNAAEKLKCRLSDQLLSDTAKLTEEPISKSTGNNQKLSLSRIKLEEILEEKGLFKSLSNLLERTLAKGRSKGYELEDLSGVVIIGGGSRIPSIKKWLLKHINADKLLTPPPIEAVAIGAIKLTPGVIVRDILNRGVALRFWDQRNNCHSWHNLFLSGQPWPTIKPLEILISSSRNNQLEIELQFAEISNNDLQEVIYLDGIPTIQDFEQSNKNIIQKWLESPIIINLEQPVEIGVDCLKLRFTINSFCELEVEGIELRSGKKIIQKVVGSIR